MKKILNNEEIQRYARHLILPEFGKKSQEKLKNSSVLIIGAGGLGCPLALYLAAAGVGKIGLVDFDNVDVSNLQRQVLYTIDDVGHSKAENAKKRILAMNPFVDVQTYKVPFKADNAMQIAEGYDLLIDGTDNFPTRYLVNDVSILTKRKNIFGSIFRFDGQVTVFGGDGPCYRCLYPDPPPPGFVPNCAEGGVLGVLPGMVGVMQANEAIKVLTGIGEVLSGRLVLFDALNMKFKEVKIKKDPECKLCSSKATVKELIDYEEFCGIPAIQPDNSNSNESDEISVGVLNQYLSQNKNIYLLDVRNPNELDICTIKGSNFIPLSELQERYSEVPNQKQVITICHHGMRSQKAMNILKENGFTDVKSVAGGIDDWAQKIDPTMARY